MICQCIDTNFSGNIARFKYQYSTEKKASNVVFKEKYYDQLVHDRQHRQDFGRFNSHDFFKDHRNSYTSVVNSLQRPENRFLMIFTENQLCRDLVKKKLVDTFKEIFPDKEVVFLKGSKLTSDTLSSGYTIKLINQLKRHVMEGDQVIMEEMDDSYAILYDLFNQNFELANNQKMCNITYEDIVDRFPIHDNFRCIILKFKGDMIQENHPNKNLEIILPSPLLNRMEKHIVDFVDINQEKLFNAIKEVKNVLGKILLGEAQSLARTKGIDFTWHLNDLIYCYNKGELVQLLAFQLNKETDRQNVLEQKIKKKLTKFYSLPMLLLHSIYIKYDEVDLAELKKNYLKTHQVNNFDEVITKIKNKQVNKFVVLTMSSYMELVFATTFKKYHLLL